MCANPNEKINFCQSCFTEYQTHIKRSFFSYHFVTHSTILWIKVLVNHHIFLLFSSDTFTTT
ncbi:MAG: hypothetical protein WCG25_00070 [bacterium]